MENKSGTAMTHEEFIKLLAEEGFAEVVTAEKTANGFVDTHSHPYDVKALVLEGVFHLQVDDDEQAYGPGQIFQLAANIPHKERYGPTGVKYVVGRK